VGRRIRDDRIGGKAVIESTPSSAGGGQIKMEALDSAIDHVRGAATGRLIVEYGDYECPHSRRAFRQIQRVMHLAHGVGFAFRHFPLTEIHPHALAAATAAEAAALQSHFWEMHELLCHRQSALEDDDIRSYAAELGLELVQFERDWADERAFDRVARDVASGIASGEVLGTPTVFVDGVVYRGAYDTTTLLGVLSG
jgi:protein-disulfide isomerase